MNHVKAMRQALEALEVETNSSWECNSYHPKIYAAITALRTAIEQAEKQEQCKEHGECFGGKCIYTTPPAAHVFECPRCGHCCPQPPAAQPCPYIRSTAEGTHHCALAQRPWVGLTRNEAMEIINSLAGQDWRYVVDAIEAKLKEKNK